MKLGPPETKMAAVVGGGGFISAVLLLVQTYDPTLHLPSVGTVSIILTGVVSLVGYFAPHTNKPEDVAQAAMDALRRDQEQHVAQNVPSPKPIDHNQVKIVPPQPPESPPEYSTE